MQIQIGRKDNDSRGGFQFQRGNNNRASYSTRDYIGTVQEASEDSSIWLRRRQIKVPEARIIFQRVRESLPTTVLGMTP